MLDANFSPFLYSVMTQNLSGSGIKFTTDIPLIENQSFLIYLNPILVDHLKLNPAILIRSGDYFFCKIVWKKPIKSGCEFGAKFIQSNELNDLELDHFVTLLNASTSQAESASL